MAQRLRNKLAARAVQAQTKPGKYSDGGGLYLIVDKSGSKRWVFIFRWKGRQPEMGLGGHPVVSLADARRAAAQAEIQVRSGINPIDARKDSKAHGNTVPTFGEFADQLASSLVSGFRNPKHRQQWQNTLGEHYCSAIRAKPVSDIDTDDILSVIQPIWTKTPETASRLRGRIERILDAAKIKGFRTSDNPARWKGHLSTILPKKPPLVNGHHKSLPYQKLPDLAAKLLSRKAVSAQALLFVILTATRVSETLKATWNEFDLKDKVWNIPAERIKTGKALRVPLSPPAMQVLDNIRQFQNLSPPSPYVFPGLKPNKHLSDGNFARLLERMGETGFVPHGFRSTFRDWVGDCTAHSDVIAEQSLGHAVGNKVERAYRRGDAFEKRRMLMNDWGNYVFSKTQLNSAINMTNF